MLLLAAAGGVVLFREELATRAAVAYLESQGVAVQNLAITHLTPGRLEATDIRLGTNGEVAIRQITATPDFNGLDVAITQAAIDGLRIKIDLTGERPLFGSLQPALDRLLTGPEDAAAPGDGDGAPTSASPPPVPQVVPEGVPEVALREASVVFATPSGPMTAGLEGTLTPAADGTLTAAASLALDSDLGRLKAKLDARRAADGTINVDADVTDGRLAWETLKVESFGGRVAATGTGIETLQLTASVDLTGLSHTPESGAALRLSQGKIEAAFDATSFLLTAALQGDGERLDLRTAADLVGGDDGTLQLDLDLNGTVETSGGLVRLITLPGPAVTRGTLVLQAGSTSVLGKIGGEESDETLLTALRDPTEMLLRNDLALTGEAILAEVALADGTEGISGHLPLSLALSGGQAILTLTQDAALRVERPSRDTLAGFGVPDDLLPLVASGLNLSLKSDGDLPLRLAATPAWPPDTAEVAVAAEASSEQGVKLGARIEGVGVFGDVLAFEGFNGSIAARAEAKSLSVGGREARGVAATLPLAADYGADGLHLELAKPGSVSIAQFGEGAPLHLAAPLRIAIDTLTLDAVPDAEGYRYSLSGREDGAAFALTAAGRDPIDVTIGALTLRLDGGFDPAAGHQASLATRLSGFALPGYGFTAEAAEVDVTLDRDLRPGTTRFAVGPFQAGGDPALTAPLALNGTVKRRGAGYDLAGEVALVEGEALAALAGRYNDDGTAQLDLDGRPLAFAPGDLQPARISPLLQDLEEVSGTVEADAALVWPRDPARENGTLRLSGLSFGGPAKVDGLDLTLDLSSLLPPTSPPGQRLTVASLEAGIPVEDIALTFALDPKPALSVAEGGFDLGGARWRIAPATLDPAAESNRVVLATDTLDLATLFKLLGVDGLSGTGVLKGSVPVVFTGGDVVIEESRFEAQGPGVLSIRIAALRSALAGGGEAVEAGVRALEDFRYDNLTITLTKSAENDATVQLSTLGSNPTVMDGQPFRFNINLESNLTSVLEALQQGYSLSDDALKRAWQLNQ
ncbi:YdbH domain-containing protein [Pelagibius sp. 7325]|uniref:intermembrane phospholipid transport protein YdbH family protein n=1 Tax=Pelagibius sp. 7325 TaxID=3131994 RepID=UPI0030ED9844